MGGSGGGSLQQEAILLTRRLVQIPSENPVGTEREISEFVYQWFLEAGAEVYKEEAAPGRNNIVAVRRGETSSPNLIYISHMDTVPQGEGWTKRAFEGELEGGLMYGRGASDMKGGLAASMLAFRNILKMGKKPRMDFVMIASVDEEGKSMLGALDSIRRGWATAQSYVIAPEPSGLAIMPAHKGVIWYTVKTRGVMCHAGNPGVGVDANHAMALIAVELKETVASLPYNDKYLGRPSLSIGKFHGGSKENVVPDECEMVIDFRLVQPMTIPMADDIVRQCIGRALAKLPGAAAEFNMLTIERPPVEAQADSPLIKAVDKAYRAVQGKEPAYTGLPAYTDAAIIAARTGCPHCISFGPGNLSQAHTIDEYVEVEHLSKAVDILTLTAQELLF